jgi:short-subunit dehydrogenase
MTERTLALITGATSGIGLEMAQQLAARQVDLVLVSRRADKLEQLAQTLRADHQIAVHVIAADLGIAGAAARVFHAVQEQNISVDWLINNAGVGIYGDHLDLDLGDVEKMLQLNVLAVSDLSLLFGNEMRARRSGRILNIASTAGYQPAPYFAAYGASKAFVLNFSEALAKELEDYGVTVSCLSPGPTDTSFFRDVDASGVKAGHFEQRDDAAAVAAIGIKLMLGGGLSKVVGVKNYLRTLSMRLAPRTVIAAISKRLLSASPTRRATQPA